MKEDIIKCTKCGNGQESVNCVHANAVNIMAGITKNVDPGIATKAREVVSNDRRDCQGFTPK